MNDMVARHYQRQFSSSGITAVSVNPGAIITGLQGNIETWISIKIYMWQTFFFKTIPQGAATTVYCATNPDVLKNGGKFYENCKVSKMSSSAKVPDLAACTALCKA